MSIPELDRWRAETPRCDELLHFNNAGAALMPLPVRDALNGHLALEEQIGAYEAQERALARTENFYQAFSRLLACSPDEIAYAENATRAWGQLVCAISFQPGDRVLIGQAEYAANYLTLLHLSRTRGLSLEVIPNTAAGDLCLTTLEQKLAAGNVRLVALTHIPSQSGAIHPAEQVGKLVRHYGALYMLDVSQSAGQLPLDVQTLQCDMMAGTGRKFLRGPRGTGFLYVRNDIVETLQPSIIDLHNASWETPDTYQLRKDARRFELWEINVAGRIALGVAADYAMQIGLENIQQRVQALAAKLRQRLSDVPGIAVLDEGTALSGIVTFGSQTQSAQGLHRRLQEQGINSSVSRRSSALLDFSRRELGDINRASVHYYNSGIEIERFCAAVAGIQANSI